MSKAGAIAILTTIFLGLFTWAGSSIVDLKTRTATLESTKEDLKDNIKDLKSDVKDIKEAVYTIKAQVTRRR